MNNEQEHSEDCLQLIMQSRTVLPASAETHRLSCESNLRNALHYGDYEPDKRRRLERLLRSLEAAATLTPQKKVEVIQHTVIPTLVSLELVDQMDS